MVVTTVVKLLEPKGEGPDTLIETAETDADGVYVFSPEQAGTYVIQVSLTDYLDTCEELRAASDSADRWPSVIREYEGELSDVSAASEPVDIEIGTTEVLDLELYCD